MPRGRPDDAASKQEFPMLRQSIFSFFSLLLPAASIYSQPPLVADPAQLAFEQGRWEDSIREHREFLEGYPEDRVSWLRIAQAERELGRHEQALESLAQAEVNLAPEAMIHLERARNLLALGRRDEALTELEAADHLDLRARLLLEEAPDLAAVRDDPRFQSVYRSVRRRVFPCEGMPKAAEFDFWLGHWEVRGPDGTLMGESRVSREEGGCLVREEWTSIAGGTGTSTSIYLPSRGQWRQIWVGSGGNHFDLAGGLVDGEMRMEGTIEYFNPEDVVAFRGTWSIGAGGMVRQRMEQFDLVSQTWEFWFDGFYRPID
jgi:hypothetical protein